LRAEQPFALLGFPQGFSMMRRGVQSGDEPPNRESFDLQKLEKRYSLVRRRAVPSLSNFGIW